MIFTIVIAGILGVVSVVGYSVYVSNARYSTDNQIAQKLTQEVAAIFGKDHILTNAAKSIKFDTITDQFTNQAGTITLADIKTLYQGSTYLPSGASLNAVQFCPQSVSNANLDTTLNAATSARYLDMIVFLNDGTNPATCYANASDLTGKQVEGVMIRYKNNLNSDSDDYKTLLMTDGGARSFATAVNTAGEQVWGSFFKTLKGSATSFTSFY